MKKTFKTILIAFIAGLSGAIVFQYIKPDSGDVYINNQASQPAGFTSIIKGQNLSAGEDFTLASALSTPSVVFITTSSISQYNQEDMFGWFFNNGGGQTSSSGSGVIYSTDGYIITNNHVIEKAEKIEVVHEKRTYTAKVIGRDPNTDLALLKIDAKTLPAIKVGTSKDIKVGEWVLAVGNPFNLNSTVTAGIISAKARSINVVNSQFPIESFIQTDAAINPGNSGGALVNIKGELIGINTAILSRTGSYAGYGFAVPVDIVSKVIKDLIKFGEVQKAFAGIEVGEVTTAIAEQQDLDDLSGVIVTYLQKEGSAEKAGLKKGDVILMLNDYIINSKSGFDEYLSYFNPGDKVKLKFKSSNKVKETTITLTNREGTTEMLKRETFTSESLGADLENISKVERDKLGIAGGVRIANIRQGLVRRLGISEGFIVTSINKVVINSPEELIDIMEKIRGRVVIEGITTNGARGYYQYYF